MNRGGCWSGGYFFRVWGNGQARRSRQQSSGVPGSPGRRPLRPADGLIGGAAGVTEADGSMAGVAAVEAG
jgi:hypothetical protein